LRATNVAQISRPNFHREALRMGLFIRKSPAPKNWFYEPIQVDRVIPQCSGPPDYRSAKSTMHVLI
jgi:hypothetical protein